MLKNIQTLLSAQQTFNIFAVFTLASIWAALISDNMLFYALPLAPVFALFVIFFFKQTFLLLLFFLPLSLEYEVSGSLATDLPTEPLMIGLMLVTFFYFLANPKQLKRSFLNHQIILLLGLHVAWIAITMLFSQVFIVSFKFLLAKTWYISTFLFLSHLFFKRHKDFKPAFWAIVVPLTFVIFYTVIRHAAKDFDFHEANRVMSPFFRNHVNYAVMLAVFLPYLFFARKWYKEGSIERLVLYSLIGIFFVGILLAMTRSAYVAVLAMPFFYVLVQKKLMRFVAWSSVIGLIFMIIALFASNYYLDLAPDFDTTIYHDEFDKHLMATFEGKDVSFMERIYRWVAASQMVQDRWFLGFGPGNFYNFYQSYTVSSFETYVSDNPEMSGVHNYFLMIMVEQGMIGFCLFFGLCISLFVKGEDIYHKLKDEKDKAFVMAIMLSLMAIVLNILMSDLIEVDKIGSLFFINIAMLVNQDIV